MIVEQDGIARKVHYDPSERTLTFNVIQDVEPILERNKALRSEKQTGDLRHVASIPNVILTRWLNEEWERGNTTIRILGPEMDALVERKLKDPDWKWLRTDK